MKTEKSSQFAERLIEEFESKGFVEPFSNRPLIQKLRKKYSQHFKIFDGGCKTSAGRLTKCGVYKIFGKRIIYYYDIRRKEEFVDFLINKFYGNNPDPGRELKSQFTRILHSHGLCWPGCGFHNIPIVVRKFKEKMIEKNKKRIFEKNREDDRKI